MRIFGITGWKNNGKTTLVERLVTEIVGRGFTVSTIKHAHHAFDVDQEGKDSWRHRQAGAKEVLVASAARWALMHEVRDGEDEPALAALLERLAPVDLVIVEGYKRDTHDKLEVHLVETGGPGGRELIARNDPTIRFVASNGDVEDVDVPVLDIDDVPTIADAILMHVGLPERK